VELIEAKVEEPVCDICNEQVEQDKDILIDAPIQN